MKVGVIGLGTMGMGAALNLHKKGHAVTGCDIRESARTEFATAGAAAVGSPAELPSDLEAVVVFVINAAQTEAGVVRRGWLPCAPASRHGDPVLRHRGAGGGARAGQAHRGGGIPDAGFAGLRRQEPARRPAP